MPDRVHGAGFRQERARHASRIGANWHGRAFLVEALVLLAFLVVSLAVLISLFVNARVEGAQGDRLTQAVQLAQNAAEQFAANPQDGAGLGGEQDGLRVVVEVAEEPHDQGVLYSAVIYVTDKLLGSAGKDADGEDAGGEVFRLKTARYVPAATVPEAAVSNVVALDAAEAAAPEAASDVAASQQEGVKP